jgi:hypothetical protein
MGHQKRMCLGAYVLYMHLRATCTSIAQNKKADDESQGNYSYLPSYT